MPQNVIFGACYYSQCHFLKKVTEEHVLGCDFPPLSFTHYNLL